MADANIWRRLIIDAVMTLQIESSSSAPGSVRARKLVALTKMFCGFFDDAAAEEFFARDDVRITEEVREAGLRLIS